MTVENPELSELLARAAAPDESKGWVDETGEAYLEEKSLEEKSLEEQVVELKSRVAQLEGVVEALSMSSPPGVDPVADAEAELKAHREPDAEGGEAADGDEGWGPCPECGSTNVDEFADGSAQCEDCGAKLSRKVKGFDFADDESVELKAEDLAAIGEEPAAGQEPGDEDPPPADDADDEKADPEPLEVKAPADELTELMARRDQLSTD